MKIEIVPSGAIEDARNVIGEFLCKQIDEDGRFHFEDIMIGLKSGAMSLWLVSGEASPCAAAVTMFVDYPRRTDLYVMFIRGTRMAEWCDDLVKYLTDFAQANKCKYIHGGGRRGWIKRLERYGFKQEYCSVQKAVQ